MGIQIELDVDDKALMENLGTIERRLGNFRPLLKRFQVQMMRSFALNFREEGRPQKWAKLSPRTIARRRRGSQRILQDTGRLRMSAMAERAQGNVTVFSTNSLRMGSSLSYAQKQQFGREGRQPARPFIIIQDEDIEVMTDLASDYAGGEGKYGD